MRRLVLNTWIATLLLAGLATSAEPNLRVEVSQVLANAAARKPVSKVEPICENRDNVKVRGEAQVAGEATVQFIPCEDRAVVALVLDGTAQLRTVGQKGPVCVHNFANVPFRLFKIVAIDADRVYSCPASGCATAALQLLGINTRLRGPVADQFVRRIANRAYQRQEDELARGVANDTERKIARQFDQDANEELVKADQSYQNDLLGELRKFSLLPEDRRLSTTEQYLTMRAILAGPESVGADALPELRGAPDVAVRVHQSLVTNAGTRLFAGKTMTNKDFEEKFGPTFKKFRKNKTADKETEKDPDQKPFSMTFAPEKPVEARFQDGKMALVVRIRGFTNGDDIYEESYDVQIPYRVESETAGVMLRRERFRFRDPSGQSLSGSAQSVATILRRQLEKVLPEEIDLQSLDLGNGLKKVGTLKSSQGSSDQGWATLAYRLEPPAAKP